MVRSPLAGGFLSGQVLAEQDGPAGSRRKTFDFPPVNRDRAFDCIDAMRTIGAAHGSAWRVALAWLLAQKHVTTIIVGARTEEQLRDNIEATSVKLGADDLATLDRVSALPSEYPGWMLARQATGREPAAR
jgi:aryl-alcohol dehydrogenase-like predicted oxidoreductase